MYLNHTPQKMRLLLESLIFPEFRPILSPGVHNADLLKNFKLYSRIVSLHSMNLAFKQITLVRIRIHGETSAATGSFTPCWSSQRWKTKGQTKAIVSELRPTSVATTRLNASSQNGCRFSHRLSNEKFWDKSYIFNLTRVSIKKILA